MMKRDDSLPVVHLGANLSVPAPLAVRAAAARVDRPAAVPVSRVRIARVESSKEIVCFNSGISYFFARKFGIQRVRDLIFEWLTLFP